MFAVSLAPFLVSLCVLGATKAKKSGVGNFVRELRYSRDA